jgi:hypothetical protein
MTGVNPQTLGEKLLGLQKHLAITEEHKSPLSEVYDSAVANGWLKDIPSCPSESIGSITAEVYLKELEGKAEQGDRYAKSMLDHIVHGVPLTDDPSG